jgi:ribonuclease HI
VEGHRHGTSLEAGIGVSRGLQSSTNKCETGTPSDLGNVGKTSIRSTDGSEDMFRFVLSSGGFVHKHTVPEDHDGIDFDFPQGAQNVVGHRAKNSVDSLGKLFPDIMDEMEGGEYRTSILVPESKGGAQQDQSTPAQPSPGRYKEVCEPGMEFGQNQTGQFTPFQQEPFEVCIAPPTHTFRYEFDRYKVTFYNNPQTAGRREETDTTLPLYAPPLNAIKLEHIHAEVISWILNPHHLSRLLRGVPRAQRPRLVSSLSDLDLTLLVRGGYLKPVSGESIKAYVKLFSVNESWKARRRLIVHPPIINELCKGESRTEYPSISLIHRLAFEHNWFIEKDMKCYFYQFELSHEVSTFFGVWAKGSHYVFTKMPMGWCMAPRIANTCSVWMASESGFPSDRIAVCIDNIYCFVHELHEADRLSQRFDATAARVGATLGSSKIACQGEVLGLKLDLRTKTVDISDKVRTNHEELLKKGMSSPVADTDFWWRLAAVLVWGMCARRWPLGQHLEILRLMSRIGQGGLSNRKWTLTIQQHARISAAIIRIFGAPSALNCNRDGDVAQPTTIYTDASNAGIAWVYVRGEEGHAEVCHRPLQAKEQDLHINDKEILAILEALIWAKARRLTSPTVLTDSSVALGSIKRGFAHNWERNSRIQRILMLYPQLSIHWISTHDNILKHLYICKRKLFSVI